MLSQDLRFGFRQLTRSPAFTLAAALTLALGIGANATIFNWLHAVIFNPLPGVNTNGLVSVRWRLPDGPEASLSWPDYIDFRNRTQTVQHLTAGRMVALSLGEGSQPERVWGALVSANYFDTMGIQPARGRSFVPAEDQNPGTHPVVLISHRLWTTRFAADSAIIGRQILLNKHRFTIIGVTPELFQGSALGLRFDIWAPAMMQPQLFPTGGSAERRGSHWLESWARLKPGVDSAKAEADLSAISAQITREFSNSGRYPLAKLTPVWREGGGRLLAPVMLLMMGVAAVVLLIACANVANLVLARASARRREIAIRQALGVTRARLIRQLLLENGLLAAIGCAAAFLATPVTAGLLQRFLPPSDLPISLVASTNPWVYVFTLSVSVFATLLFGLAPAISASRLDLVHALKEDSGGSAGARKPWLRNSLVVAQVALSLVLLIAAGLLLKSLDHARSADPGFDPRNVLIAGIDLQPNGYDTPRGRLAVNQALTRISNLPGVAAASTVRRLPLGMGGTSTSSFSVGGYVPAPNEDMFAYTHTVSPDYFLTMNTPLTAGREFTSADTDQSSNVAVINQTLARKYFPGVDPLGRSIQIAGAPRTIVGIAKDSKFRSLDEPNAPAVYFPLSQVFASETYFLVRTTADPAALGRAVTGAIHEVDPALPVYGLRTLQDSISVAYFSQTLGSSLLGVFGALALVLAAVGLYGVLAYSVTQRSREVGIRMAIGASRAQVFRLVIGQGLTLAAVGIAIGLALSVAVTRLMRTLLFDVSATDLPTMAAVSSLLLLVVLAAAYIPARRATRIDPIRAIRYE